MMKSSAKTILLSVILVLMTGCSAQYRAQRHLRRAIELCPDLEMKKAHPIDTFLGVPVYTDATLVPLKTLWDVGALKVKTEHGTFDLNVNDDDSTLAVGFTSDSLVIHYHDMFYYSQVDPSAVETKKQKKGNDLGTGLLVWFIGFGFGMTLAVCLLRKPFSNEKQ